MKKLLALLLLLLSTTSFAQSNDKELQKQLDKIANHYRDVLGFNGVVLVARGDDILFAKGLGYSNIEHETPITLNTSFRLASLTKQFTASAILVLAQQNKLKLNEPVSTYLLPLKGGNRNNGIGDAVTIAHLLNHTAGTVRDIEELSDLGISKRYVEVSQIIELAKDSKISFEPGSKFSYSNVGYSLLAAVIERATGMSYKDALDDLLFVPNKLTQTMHDDSHTLVAERASGYMDLLNERVNAPYEDKSYVIGAGSIMSSASDLFRWSRLLFRGNILSAEQQETLRKPVMGDYSFGWFIDSYEWQEGGKKRVGVNINHGGGSQGFSSQVSYLQEHDIALVLLTNVIPNKLSALNSHLIGHLMGTPQPLPKPGKKQEILAILWEKGPEAALAYVQQLRVQQLKKGEGEQDLVPASFDLILTGRGYLDIHSYAKAEKIFALVAMDRPDWEYGHLFLGLVYSAQGEIQKAFCMFRKAMEVAPESTNARSEIEKLEGTYSNGELIGECAGL